MKRKHFATEQIIKILKEAELGIKITELCRKYGIAEQTFYNWGNKYGGMDISEAKRIKCNILVLANLQTMPSFRVSTASSVMNV